MALVRDIVQRALRKIGVVGQNEPMTTDQEASGVAAFNEMVSAWPLAGVGITFADKAAGDTFPLADQFREGTIYLLASRMAPEYMVPQAFDADDFFRRIQAAHMVIDTMTLEPGIARLGRRYLS